MTKNLKYFLIPFVLSFPFWWGANLLEKNMTNFFFNQELAQNPGILAAQVNLPIKYANVANLEIAATAVISVLVDGQEKILFEKNAEKRLSIASLTKLMSVYVILENYDLEQIVEISEKAAGLPGGGEGMFKAGEKFRAKELLYPMLIESNNAATLALAELWGEEAFVELMNSTVKDLELEDTRFVNPTGLDPDDLRELTNFSSAKDLIKLSKNILEKHPLIWEILRMPEMDFYSLDGVLHHKIINTNAILTNEVWQKRIIGGKTGFTYQAGECFLLVLKAPNGEGYLVNVVLGAGNRLEEMKKLINWLYQAYQW